MPPPWDGAAERDIKAWKLVSRADGSFATAACVIPRGAPFFGDRDSPSDSAHIQSDRLLVLGIGSWDESGDVVRFRPEEGGEYSTAAGVPGRVVYRQGELVSDPEGLWAYLLPWQTYWPFSAARPLRKEIDAGEYGSFSWPRANEGAASRS